MSAGTDGDPRRSPPGTAIEIERPGPGSHRISLTIDGRIVDTLADLPPLRNRLLFVGTRPSADSVAAGHYHQGSSGRTLWQRLIRAGILPADTPLDTADDALVAAGHGITDLAKVPETPDEPVQAAVAEAALTAGVGPLWQKVAMWRPGAIMFVDRHAASIAAGRRLQETWGQLAGVALAGRPCFLMPGPDATPDVVDAGVDFLHNLVASLPD